MSRVAASGNFEAELAGYRLVCGVGSLARLGQLVRELGCSRPLVVTDPGVREAGHLERTLSALLAAGCEPGIFDEVAHDPTTRDVEAGVQAARAHDADLLVGLGGGSAMDCAKGINFLLTNGGRMEDYWGSSKASRPMLPGIGVPTTAGTGSEAQSYALIAQEKTKAKMACGDKKAMFRAVVLDPTLVQTAPRAVTAAAGIDAVSHAVESYVSLRRNPVSQLFAREAWRLLAEALPRALDGTASLADWGELQLGAHLAGAAIEQSMLGAAHACANPLTAHFPLAHGVAVGLMLPAVIRFNEVEAKPLYDELDRDLEARVRALRAAAGLPARLRDCRVPREAWPMLAAEAERQWTAAFNPRPVSRVELHALYEAADA